MDKERTLYEDIDIAQLLVLLKNVDKTYYTGMLTSVGLSVQVSSFVDVDECTIALDPGVPCFNGGTCTNTLGSYRCQCKPGWTGQNCEVGKVLYLTS